MMEGACHILEKRGRGRKASGFWCPSTPCGRPWLVFQAAAVCLLASLSSCRYWHRDAVCVHAGVPLLQRDHSVDLLLPGQLLPEPPALVLRRCGERRSLWQQQRSKRLWKSPEPHGDLLEVRVCSAVSAGAVASCLFHWND